MQFFPDRTTFLNLGPLSIKWYAIIIVSGAFLAYFISKRNITKKGYSVEILDNVFFGALLFGVFGARIWYVLFENVGAYLSNPIRILYFHEGGLAIHGGIIAGGLFAYYYLKKKGISFFDFVDEILYTTLLAQAIGRFGNFINQEAFGPIVSESFFNGYPEFIKQGMFIDGAYRMPMFLFESVMNLIGFFLIHFFLIKRKDRKQGQGVYAYLMWYGFVRFFIEIFRTDALLIFNTPIKIAQVISIIFLIVGGFGFCGLFNKTPKKSIVIFDFDGTLMDSRVTIQKTFEEMFQLYPTKVTITEEDYDFVVGPSLKTSFEKYFDLEYDILFEKYKAIKNQYLDLTKPIEHAKETVEILKQQGYKLAIVSNKITEAIMVELKKFEMDSYFDVVLGIDKVNRPKPSEQPVRQIELMFADQYEKIWMIGDSQDDIKMANNAGIFSIGYYESVNRKKQLEEEKPNYVVDNLSKIVSIIKGEKYE